MDRKSWEYQFERILFQKLGIKPDQVKFHWKQYARQRFSPESAIADLEQKHELYPMLGILPKPQQVTKV